MLSTYNKQWKVKQIEEFRTTIFPKYYKVVEEAEKKQKRQMLYDEIIAKIK